MKSLIFIAAPAAGKGTQASMLSEKYNLPHISTGDLLRNASSKDSEIGRFIKNQMISGGLVPDDITIELLKERIFKDDCNNGYILDGFPRNIDQAILYDKLLSEIGKSIGHVIVLDLDRKTAMDRIVGRLSCKECGTIYNVNYENMKPKCDGVCDVCGGALTKRADDNEETFNKRFDTYLSVTEPIIRYYEEKGLVNHVYSGDAKKIVFSNILKVLGGDLND